jgi:ATP-dependent DNA helicase RecQ
MLACDTACDVCTGVELHALAADAMAANGTVVDGRERKRRASAGLELAAEDEALFQRLRELRKSLADRQRVPSYIVFSDKVLVEMATRRPSNEIELLEVSGVGPAKLRKYGSEFLAVLRSS